MNKICKYCNEYIKFEIYQQFGGHLTNCKFNPKKIERDLKSKRKKEFEIQCKCGVNFKLNITPNQFEKGNYKKCCSSKCSNSRNHSELVKLKISNSLKKNRPLKTYEKNCIFCQKSFIRRNKNGKFCSRFCAIQFRNKYNDQGRKGGLKSAQSQNKRSKNEVLFAEYCIKKFKNVLTNEPIFNGWDADIIIEDLKIAILWNGIWHYKKITKDHSLLQVENRDKIKIKEIISFGYTPYIIKDIGKFNVEKVNDEWVIFNLWIENRSIIIN